ncbi:MAG: cyclic pyranopterin monophosphate synthase MoaC [Candidatus Methanoperedens sp.]|nr:cyclic pyranopterin monophosphate synthase MoaC [Candidatus Methanoperedens sp.]
MKFSHIEGEKARMVDISEKKEVSRRAISSGEIQLKPKTIEAIRNKQIIKGSVLETARIASIIAIKNTSSVIPMCHQITITGIDVQFDIGYDNVKVTVDVRTIGKTGVEMEALHGASVALLTIWDMVKSVEKDDTGNYPSTAIRNIKVIEKIKEQK